MDELDTEQLIYCKLAKAAITRNSRTETRHAKAMLAQLYELRGLPEPPR